MVSCTSSNGPPRNYSGVLEVNLKTCAKGTKSRVYTRTLMKPFGDKSSLKTINGDIRFSLDTKDPLTTHKILISSAGYKISSTIME